MPFSQLSANRYFWPIYMMAFLSVGVFSSHRIVPKMAVKVVLVLIIFHQSILHFSDFRLSYSHDWEASLIHLPYYGLRTEALAFMDKNNIAMKSVGTPFPAINSEKHIALNDDDRSMKTMDYRSDEYLFYSNIMNSIKSKDLEYIHTHFEKIWSAESGRIKAIIFQRKNRKN